MAPQTAAPAPSSPTYSSMPHLPCAVCHGLLEADATTTAESSATSPIDADLHPLDSELVIEIRAMFLEHWNMDAVQADARMANFHYGQAVGALSAPAPGAISA